MNTYFNDTLQDLLLQMLKKEKILRECHVLEERYNALKAQTEVLETSRDKEEAEAQKAKDSFFLSHFAKGKVDKEVLEAYVAQEKYEMSRKELDILQKQLRDSRERLQKLGDCDVKYQQLYEKTREELLEKKDERAQAILKTEAQIASISGHLKEAEEAMALVKEAEAQIEEISEEINVLKAYGFWNVTVVKRLDDLGAGLNVLLTKLKGEMKDISLRGEFSSFYVEGGSTMMDIFLDGAWSDPELRERVYKLPIRLDNVRSDIYKARDAIENVLKKAEENLETKQKLLRTLIVEAE